GCRGSRFRTGVRFPRLHSATVWNPIGGGAWPPRTALPAMLIASRYGARGAGSVWHRASTERCLRSRSSCDGRTRLFAGSRASPCSRAAPRRVSAVARGSSAPPETPAAERFPELQDPLRLHRLDEGLLVGALRLGPDLPIERLCVIAYQDAPG